MLLLRIERHLRAGRIPPSRFGREAMNDPKFVFNLRDGRVPGAKTTSRVAAYLDRAEKILAEQQARARADAH